MSRRVLGGAALWAWAGPALACSGPGAAQAIQRAERLGWGLAALAVALSGAALVVARRRGVVGSPMGAAVLLVVAHPGFWMSARTGDCGQSRVLGAIVFTALVAALGLWAALRPAPEPPDSEGGP